MAMKKSSSTTKTSKRAAARAATAHPSWIEMIKECIAANPDDSRQGVSRPHIKKYVEEQYNLQIGNAQNTQLARAIATGAEKGIFILPKGPAGKVKLPPKNAKPADTSASKENKPARASAVKSVTKGRPVKSAHTRATAVKSTSARRTLTKAKTVAAARAAAPKKVEKKPEVKATKASKAVAPKSPKKVLAGKKVAPVKKTTVSSKRGAAKKAVTGTSVSVKAKAAAAAKKAPTTSTSRKVVASKKLSSKRSSVRAST